MGPYGLSLYAPQFQIPARFPEATQASIRCPGGTRNSPAFRPLSERKNLSGVVTKYHEEVVLGR